MTRLSRQNKIVHGMWIGSSLSRLELLTIRSFQEAGHIFHLWAYDDLREQVPRGVRLHDASIIIPRDQIFMRTTIDPETGVGKNSYGAPFSDLFRYKLLYLHGGIWVDMDITCLQPFDFDADYVFRPHRVGVVGSILKCPKGNSLMRKVFEETASTVDSSSEYLAPNKILSKYVVEGGLEKFIIPNISNPDYWTRFIKPMTERLVEIPREWHAIHWINEMWRTLAVDEGSYRGAKLVTEVPDKDRPIAGSTLWEMYRSYGLIDARAPAAFRRQIPVQLGVKRATRPISDLGVAQPSATHLNIVLPSLVRGGAERSVLEVVTTLCELGTTVNLYILHRARQRYPLKDGKNLKITYSEDDLSLADMMRAIAQDVLRSSSSLAFVHLLTLEQMRYLWELGITTIPVLHNVKPGWPDQPQQYSDYATPFVVAVSEEVSRDVRAVGFSKPIVTLRHELQRWYDPELLLKQRREVRAAMGIGERTLLIGMVGQFKLQKGYVRAVRVLHEINQIVPSKLVILGGWDHEYGAGRIAYEAMCREAVDLGVIADVIAMGNVHPIDPYLAAFDVFLNTSIYEGLSIAVLEAIQAGCPVVSADAGGNREVLPASARLILDGTNIGAYVDAILSVTQNFERQVPTRPADSTLVPVVWSLLAKHGVASSVAQIGRPNGTLFVVSNLQIGGPQRSLLNLLNALPAHHKTFVLLLQNAVSDTARRVLTECQVPFSVAASELASLQQVEFILTRIDQLNVRSICFWDANPEVKLLVAKILSARSVRVIDVSPGPMLFEELAASSAFQRRISFDSSDYFGRLDGFVAKYRGGLPRKAVLPRRARTHVIPNGVPLPPRFVPLPRPEHLLPDRWDPELAIGTCSRIVPDKDIGFLLEVMKILASELPRASLTIVGAADARSEEYRAELLNQLTIDNLPNVIFVGPHDDVRPFLQQFKVFVMAGHRQGCPNASLEAMSMGLPVVSTRSGGVAEQVNHGRNGFLVTTPRNMARRISQLLLDKRLRRRFGEVSRQIAREQFSMESMAQRYLHLLDDSA